MPFLAPIAAIAATAVGVGSAVDQASKNQKKNPNDPNSSYVNPNENKGDQARMSALGDWYREQGQGIDVDKTNLNADIGLGRESRGSQMESLNLAREAALGKTPSVAQMQMQQGIQNSIAAQQSAAAGARGGPQALAAAQRQAALGANQMQLEGVGGSSMLRAQEMASARQQYGQQSQALRAQDLMQRGMSADEAFRQANLELQNKTAMGQLGLGAEGLGQGYSKQTMQREMGNAGMSQQRTQSDRDLAMDITKGGIGLVSGIAGGAAASDERAKKDIQPVSGGQDAKKEAAAKQAAPFLAMSKEALGSMGQHHQYQDPFAAVQSGVAGKKDIAAVSENYSAKHNDVGTVPAAPGGPPMDIIRENPYGQEPPAGPPAGQNSDWDMFLNLFGGGGEQPAVQGALDRSNDVNLAPGMVPSDERGKQKNGGSGVADAFLDTLTKSASTYKYKDPQDEPRSQPTGGHYMGIMAQDLERVPGVGRQLVSEGPRGKQVEIGPMMSALAAGLGRLNEKVGKKRG